VTLVPGVLTRVGVVFSPPSRLQISSGEGLSFAKISGGKVAVASGTVRAYLAHLCPTIFHLFFLVMIRHHRGCH
jgi:hypothetical protein